MNSDDLRIPLSDVEAKTLWNFLEKRRNDLDEGLLPVLKKLEERLWDRFTISDLVEKSDE